MYRKLNVLHVSNDFPNSSLYKQLVIHLDDLDVKQTVYSAVRSKEESRYQPPELSHLQLYIHNILYPYDRAFFRLKIRKIYKDLCKEVDISNVDIVHAHTLYSDGAVALKLKENFNIPFIVTVRNTALNVFNRYRPDLKWWRDKILVEAKKVVFLSPAYKKKLLMSVSSGVKKRIIDKLIIIPNGLDPNFLNENTSNDNDKSDLKLLFVGRFLKLKNIPKLIEAIEKLKENLNVTLTLVGRGEDEEKIQKMIDSKPYVNHLGFVKDKKRLRNIYRSHDIFVMVSKPETFGLVYIEALSQGVPIIHTEGEGVDGYFEEGDVSETVKNPSDVKEIAQKIRLLANRLDNKLQENCIKAAQKFDWSLIAKQYKNLY
jgi:glycosyltransferase involved in cell wall biosynthesis